MSRFWSAGARFFVATAAALLQPLRLFSRFAYPAASLIQPLRLSSRCAYPAAALIQPLRFYSRCASHASERLIVSSEHRRSGLAGARLARGSGLAGASFARGLASHAWEVQGSGAAWLTTSRDSIRCLVDYGWSTRHGYLGMAGPGELVGRRGMDPGGDIWGCRGGLPAPAGRPTQPFCHPGAIGPEIGSSRSKESGRPR